jgi:hypothetical protein
MAMLLLSVTAGAGLAFLLAPAWTPPPPAWLRVAEISELPTDGTPIRVAVAVADRDAWTRRPNRVLGHAFLRRVPTTGEVIALNSVTQYGASVEFEHEIGALCDRGCWGLCFDLEGRCLDGFWDLLKWKVQTNDGSVYINRELPQRGD